MFRPFALCLLLSAMLAVGAAAQSPVRLTLKEAEEMAEKNHPRISAALLASLAANQVPTEARAAKLPNVMANVTGAGASENARIAAGGLNNPLILSRGAAGVSVSQLVTDFGRTDELIDATRLRARSAEQAVEATRAQVLFQVDRAYFLALKATAVLKVAEKTVDARQLVAEQAEALRQSGLKSGLDVSFANYNLAEARLLLSRSRNDVKAAFAELSAALGEREEQAYELADEAVPPPFAGADWVAQALSKRPDLLGLHFERDAAFKLAEAEKSLWKPTISAVWAAGWAPFGDEARLPRGYNAVGVNLAIPIFNGRLFQARAAEADFRAKATEQALRDAENRVASDVRIARLNVENAAERLGLAAQLLARARESLDLAQERYRLGLSSIVEMSQAQLNVTAAEIENASAKYDLLVQRAVLAYQAGARP